MFESLQGAIDRAEKVLISGEWFSVGAVVEDFDSSAGTITISEGGLRDSVAGDSQGIIGFTTAASNRVSLNPAVRSFLLNNVRKETVLNSVSLAKREVVIREFDVVNPTMETEGASSGPGTFDTMDVRLSELDGWELRRGDEVIYTTRINMGDTSVPVYRDVHQVNRIIDVIRGDSTPQDSVDNPYVRVQLAEPVDESFIDQTDEQRLVSTKFAFRNKTHVVPDVSIDWDSLYVGTGVGGDGILDGTYLLGWDKLENVLILNQEVATVDYRVEFDPGEIYVNGTKGESYGENYSTDTNFRIGVEFSAPDTSQSNGGVQMEGYAVPDGTGGVEKVIITRQGRGYTTPPTITIEKGVNDSGGATRAKGSVLFDPQYWWADSSGSDPSHSPTFALQHRLGGDDSSILMSANFTNYDGLAPGQPVFGDGVSPGTVITRIFPAIQRVEVTPGGLPTRLSVTDSGVTLSSDPSDYYTDGFEHVLQMPDTFNKFHTLRVGQRVTFPQNSNVPETTITALDTTYRQIGLKTVPDGLDSEAVSEVVFESLDRVEFGMITRTGSGNASFSVTPFGYEAMAVTTPRLASGTARLGRYENDSGRYELEVKEFEKTEGIQVDRYVSGSGIKHGYRVASFDGRNVRLKSAGLTLIENSTDTFEVDSLFTAFSRLEVGMPVYGGTVPSGTKIAPNGIDPANRTVTLEGGTVGTDLSAISGDVVFGDPFTDNFVSRDTALTSFSVHRKEAEISSLIAASNIRDAVRYVVSTEGGADEVAGSLARHMLITQRNEYHTAIDSFGYQTQPTVTFLQNVSSIELTEPLPAIVASDIAIDGSRLSDVPSVEVVGRFISTTSSGANVLSDTIVNGFSVQGADANGTVLRNLKFGGFSNGAAIRIDGSSDVIVDGVTIGITGPNIRSSSDFGILVTGDSVGTTIRNTEVVSAEQAGIRVEEDATETRIIGVTLGRNYGSESQPNIFWNNTGLEVAADDVYLGHDPILWKVFNSSNEVSFYEATFAQGERWVSLPSMSQLQWQALKPGLAIVGVGLVESSIIEAVDAVNERVYLSKATTRTVIRADVLIGVQATGIFETDELEFENINEDRLYVGQTVNVLSGLGDNDVFSTTIIGLDGLKAILADALPTDGMYEKGIRLVEFGESPGNVIQYNRTGIKVGLYGTASGDLNGNTLTLDSEFIGWSSLKPGVEVFVSGAGDENPFVVSEVNETAQQIKVNKSFSENFLLSPVRFSGADDFEMVATSVIKSIDDGLVLGGGENHQIGRSSVDLMVFADKAIAEAGLSSGETIFQLVSHKENGVTPQPVDAGLADSESINYRFTVSEDVADWLNSLDSVAGIPVFGTGIPDETTVVQFGEDNSGAWFVEVASSGNLTAISDVTVYFGLQVFVRCQLQHVVVGDAVEGEHIYEFTTIDEVKGPVGSGDDYEAGYIVLSSPDSGLVALEQGSPPTDGEIIRFVNRTGLSNVLSYNAGFGISLADANPETKLYDSVANTWRIAGNFIDLSYDINTSSWNRLPNALGPLSPLMFATIFGADSDPGSIEHSGFDRTDQYGNQYSEEQQVSSGSSSGDDNPFGNNPTDGDDGTGDDGSGDDGSGDDGSGDDGTGDGSGPGVRPGVPF